MAEAIMSLFGLTKKLLPSPPSVTITVARIPADGTPPHLIQVPTITCNDVNTPSGTDAFFFHIPDLRQFWATESGWRRRDLERLTLKPQQGHSEPPTCQESQKEHHLQQWLYLLELQPYRLPYNLEILRRQRYLVPETFYSLEKDHLSCAGVYYMFYSFDVDELPKNSHFPAWVGDPINGRCGDVFLVKMSPYEYGGYGWALYEDIGPEFLDWLAEEPKNAETTM